MRCLQRVAVGKRARQDDGTWLVGPGVEKGDQIPKEECGSDAKRQKKPHVMGRLAEQRERLLFPGGVEGEVDEREVCGNMHYC